MAGLVQHKAGHDELKALFFDRISNQAVARMSESDIREANPTPPPDFASLIRATISTHKMQAGVHPNQFAGHVA